VTAIRHFIVALASRVEAVFLLMVALALTPLLITLLGLTLLSGLVPIPQIRKLVLTVQSKLTATVGDSFAFVESPIRAALIRECVLEGLERLKPLCEHTVVLAHSQGAAVVLDVLGALEPSNEKREVEAVWRLVPDTLITFGAGTNQLASQKVLADRLPKMALAVLERNGRAHSMGRRVGAFVFYDPTLGLVGFGPVGEEAAQRTGQQLRGQW